MPTVLLGLSGGIDSSVSAYLLKEKGFKVIGITLKVWDDVSKCCSMQDIEFSKKLCNDLKIPYHVIEMQDIFREEVINYFIKDYLNGKTPNPCVVCNRSVKLKKMYELLKEFKADHIATGHYARIRRYRGKKLIKRGMDLLKDQSYFLSLTDEKIREKMIFPMGSIYKTNAYKIFREFYKEQFHGRESQDLCFISDGHYSTFLKNNIDHDIPQGDYIHKDQIVGTHKGYLNYTVGQRKNLGVSYKYPLYVSNIDPVNNKIYLSSKKDVYKKVVNIEKPVFHIDENIILNDLIYVKVRHRSKVCAAYLIKKNGNYLLELKDEPQILTPGQLAVMYMKNYVVGAGWIV